MRVVRGTSLTRKSGFLVRQVRNGLPALAVGFTASTIVVFSGGMGSPSAKAATRDVSLLKTRIEAIPTPSADIAEGTPSVPENAPLKNAAKEKDEFDALLTSALQTASELEARQRELSKETSALKTRVSEVGRTTTPRASFNPPAPIAVDFSLQLEKQQDALIREIIRLRKSLRSTAKSAPVPSGLVAGDAKTLNEEMDRLKAENARFGDVKQIEAELRSEVHYHQSRADQLENKASWAEQELRSLKAYAHERRQLLDKLAASEKHASDLEIQLKAANRVDLENELLKEELINAKEKLGDLRSSADQFMKEQESTDVDVSEAQVLEIQAEKPKERAIVVVKDGPVGPGQLGFR